MSICIDKAVFVVSITCVASVRVYLKINVSEREGNSFFGIRVGPITL